MFSQYSVGAFLLLPLFSGLLGIAGNSGAVWAQANKSAFQDWSGTLEQLELPDKSVLSEYTSQTFAGGTPGASLRVAFVPRFDCVSIFSVVIPQSTLEALPDSQSFSIVLQVDDTQMEYPFLRDDDDESVTFSYNSDHQGQEQLRTLLDDSSRATILISSPAELEVGDAEAESQAIPVYFSLLGSRLSMNNEQTACTRHQPIPLE